MALVVACGGSKDSSVGADPTGPSPTSPTEVTAMDSETAPPVDLSNGAFDIRYAFNGWAGAQASCADVGADTLYLDLSLSGATEPTQVLVCDDAHLLVPAEQPGAWTIYLHTALSAATADGAWGASYAIIGEAVPGELTEVYVEIVCQANGTDGICA